MKMILTTTFSLFFLFTLTSAGVTYTYTYADGTVATIEEPVDTEGSHETKLSTETLEDPEYEFTFQFGDGFEKQTGKLDVKLWYGSQGIRPKNYESVDLTEGKEEGIELIPGSTLTIKRKKSLSGRLEEINQLTWKWKKTGSEEGNTVVISKVDIKAVGEPDLVRRFKSVDVSKLPSGSEDILVTYHMYEFTIQLGDEFNKQTGRLYALLKENDQDRYWDTLDLTEGTKRGIELTPGSTLTLQQSYSVDLEHINRLSLKWKKTGWDEGNVINIKNVVVKPVGQSSPVKEFTNDKPLVSGEKVDLKSKN